MIDTNRPGARRLLPLAAWILLGAQLAAAQPAQVTLEAHVHLRRMRAAFERCDWRAAERAATIALELSPRGSATWFSTVGSVAQARYRIGPPFEWYALTREALELAAQLEADVESQPISGRVQAAWSEIEICSAAAFQRHGNHSAALAPLGSAIARLRDGRAEKADHLLPQALLAQAQSLQALGLDEQSRPLLEELRDRFEGTYYGAIASVLLQEAEGVAAYRGRYRGDSGHAERARGLRELLPGVRAEVARTFGVDERRMAVVPVGVVDHIEGFGHLGAVTLTDPRQPDFPPVVVVFSRPLALGLLDPREMLLHEFGHVALSLELGTALEDLPGWLVEGAVQAVAAPWEDLADSVLAHSLTADPKAFLAPGFRVLDLLDFRETACKRASGPALGLGLWPMQKGIRERGWQGLVPALRRHASVELALNEAFGQAPPPPGSVEIEIAQLLEARRAAARPELEEILRANAQGPAAGLKCAERILAGAPMPLARGFALWDRASALEALGRLEDAASAFAEIAARRGTQSAYVESARRDRVRCLLKLGHEAQAERELAALERDAVKPVIAAWATEHLAELRRSRSK